MQEAWLLSPGSANGLVISGTSLSGTQVAHLQMLTLTFGQCSLIYCWTGGCCQSLVTHAQGHLYKSALELSTDRGFGADVFSCTQTPKLMCPAQGEGQRTECEHCCERGIAEVQEVLRCLSCSKKIKSQLGWRLLGKYRQGRFICGVMWESGAWNQAASGQGQCLECLSSVCCAAQRTPWQGRLFASPTWAVVVSQDKHKSLSWQNKLHGQEICLTISASL